jgi:6-pyruvoyltetrahydropterin/6-carboxytetrahydropterin synthase
MIRLSRETRFALVPPAALDDGKSKNSWAGWPATDLIAPQLKLQLIIEGNPDSQTGYLCNIKLIDQMLRKIVIEDLIAQFDKSLFQNGQQMLDLVWSRVAKIWPTIAPSPVPPIDELKLHLSPFLILSARPLPASNRELETMPENTTSSTSSSTAASMPPALVTQQFEFSAAHRLHCESLTENQNQELFGKCNNPNGHGHNYVVEVSIEQDRGEPIELRNMEAIVKRLIIDPLDHKHLNEDVEEFSKLNPTVENIATVIFDWLDGQFGQCKLESVKVFETPKTWAQRRAC